MGEHGQAALAYKKAVEANEGLLPAWKGLVELHSATQESEPLIEALERLVGHSMPSIDNPSCSISHI